MPDSTLRNRLRIPGHIGLHGRIEMHNGAFAPVLALAVDSGTLTLKGHLTPKSQQYDLTLACDSFPAKDFLPADSLGRITLQLETRGKGFDPLVAKTQSELKLQIDRFDYLGFPYNGIALEAVLKDKSHFTPGRPWGLPGRTPCRIWSRNRNTSPIPEKISTLAVYCFQFICSSLFTRITL